MLRTSALVFFLVSLVAGAVQGQTSAGAIAGMVSDQTGGVLADVRILIVNRHTGQTRTVITSAEGVYAATGLAPGLYRVTVQVAAFKPLDHDASVEAGTTTTLDVSLELGEISERMTVGATEPLIRRTEHQVGGVVSRAQIESLPLNGRNFLELARLEPGVTNTARLADGRTFVSSLGGGLPTIPRIGATRVTIDGGNVTTPGTAGVLLQVSQDVVQEFQIATVNFDPASSLTSNGAINIVTRSGTNTFQGSGFYFYRDHHLAAYPALNRDARNPNPSFERQQFGSYIRRPAANRSRLLLRKPRANRPGRGGIDPAPRTACGARRHLSDTLCRQSDQPASGCTAASQSHRIRAVHLRSQHDVREPRPIGPAVELVEPGEPDRTAPGGPYQRLVPAPRERRAFLTFPDHDHCDLGDRRRLSELFRPWRGSHHRPGHRRHLRR